MTRRWPGTKTWVSMALSLSLLVSVALPAAANGNGEPELAGISPQFPVPQSDTLQDTGPDQRRWLSLPESRLIVNPYRFGYDHFNTNPYQYSTGAQLPLNIGYYTGPAVFELSDALGLYYKKDIQGSLLTAFEETFDDVQQVRSSWVVDSNVDLAVDNGAMHISLAGSGGDPWGGMRKSVTIDLDESQYIEIDIPKVAGGAYWSLKLNDGSLSRDIELVNNFSQSGKYLFDIKEQTGWSGTKTFTIIIFTVNGRTTVDNLRILGVAGQLKSASSYTTEWYPHQIAYSADYPDGVSVAVEDFFYDTDTVTRKMTFSERPEPGEGNGGGPGEPAPGPVVSFEEPFDDLAAIEQNWSPDPNSNLAVDNGGLLLGIEPGGDPWAGIRRSVTVDLDETPFIEVDVRGVQGTWSIKVNDGQAVDLQLGLGNGSGKQRYNIADLTGWSGEKTFEVILFTIEGSTAFDHLKIFNGIEEQPEEPGEEPGPWGLVGKTFTLSGEYSGRLQWNDAQRTLTVEGTGYALAISLGGNYPVEAKRYRTRPELLTGLAADTAIAEGYWSLDIPLDELDGASEAVTIAFSPQRTGTAQATQLARAPFVQDNIDLKHAETEQFWNDYLQKVPHPYNFDLEIADTLGVTAERTYLDYYRAWVFLAANILPAMPEGGFLYSQFATGKPSMWGDGAEEAKYASSWESFLAMQLYAFVDPDLAWDGYKGMMSLVDDEGMLGGESLPSRKAETAMILYQLTGDIQSLHDVYPALKRYLNWRIDNPRWIYLPANKNNVYERDADFVFSGLIDLGHARDIATILGLEDEAADWEATRQQFYTDSLEWFWETPTSLPNQYYYLDSEIRHEGTTLWVAQGVYVDLLSGDYLTSLMNRFYSDYDVNKSFVGMGMPKYPNISFLIYGFLEKGYLEEAQQVLEVSMRDVVRAYEFAEQYDVSHPPRPTGVRPSVFGAGMLIDTVLLKNGYKLDKGKPQFVNIFGADGGVENLMIRGHQLNLVLDGQEETVTLTGSLVGQSPLELDAALGDIVTYPHALPGDNPPAMPVAVAYPLLPTNQNVTVELLPPAPGLSLEYRLAAESAWTTYSGPLSISANTVVYARAVASDGGRSMVKAVTINQIDRTAPTATVYYSTTAANATSVDAYLIVDEPVSVTNNGGAFRYTFTANGSFTFQFVDAAGNTGSATATVSNIASGSTGD
ncbi:hypothetical protein [Cohnella phaseoli]|uniref:Uncharacterized protein n=1 Tax=Cohnella phaseoli TaxID=456490 RepID=A0A3D9KHF8_9BACL|nr:hypothetical protein [Cohnella phaseoli]RED85577.1 hypothetical protein DFP98_104282 [Cohnella phaseoli]